MSPAVGPSLLVLHPHPDMGGDMHNPVVTAVAQAAMDAGLGAHRFDFSSSAMDVAVAEALAHLPDGPTVVVGYSFGALVASLLTDERITGWVLIAPPFGMAGPAADAPIAADPRPKLVLVPAHDQFCPPATARSETATWTATTVEDVPGADHFLSGALADVAARAVAFSGASVAESGTAAPENVGDGPTAGR